ncbi:MAG: hypothetical protein QG570_112 [Patescibacteria group bacterium]|nr:hypothetical protein [Patescibacteria group bacterium]
MRDTNPLIEKSIEFIKAASAGVILGNGEKYYKHCIRVKEILEEAGIDDENVLCAALLHDVLKFQTTTAEEITKEFNDDISFLVVKFGEVAELNIPNQINNPEVIHKLLIQLASDIRVLLIRLADRLDNIRNCSCFSVEKQTDIAHKALGIYAPISDAVGIYSFVREFQKLALRILEPETCNKIEKFVVKKRKDLEPRLRKMQVDIQEFVTKEEIDAQTNYRNKSVYSIYAKVKRKFGDNFNEQTISQLGDFVGIRVLVPTIDNCYQILAHLQNKWEMINEDYDDYIANPKPNGYRTLQTSFKLDNHVKCEVQIRTYEMHEQNEYGPASHFTYKYGSSKKSDAKWIKSLIDMKESITSNLASENTKIGLFENTIFVFTPKNKLITLPKGSTPVDFAYSVHSDIGDHCSGAKINDRIAKLDTELKSGDVIEILISKNHKPSKDWLHFVKTREARKHIASVTSK